MKNMSSAQVSGTIRSRAGNDELQVRFSKEKQISLPFEQFKRQHDHWVPYLSSEFRKLRGKEEREHYRVDHIVVFPDSADLSQVRIENEVISKWFFVCHESDLPVHIEKAKNHPFTMGQKDIRFIAENCFSAFLIHPERLTLQPKPILDRLQEAFNHILNVQSEDTNPDRFIQFLSAWDSQAQVEEIAEDESGLVNERFVTLLGQVEYEDVDFRDIDSIFSEFLLRETVDIIEEVSCEFTRLRNDAAGKWNMSSSASECCSPQA